MTEFERVRKMVKDKELPFTAINSDRERVVFLADGDNYIVITHQNNGWIRENHYYADGTIEELYKRGCDTIKC